MLGMVLEGKKIGGGIDRDRAYIEANFDPSRLLLPKLHLTPLSLRADDTSGTRDPCRTLHWGGRETKKGTL